MTDIFAKLEEAADEEEKKTKINLGVISLLVKKQKDLERRPDPKDVEVLYNFIKWKGLSIGDVEEALKKVKKDLFLVRQIQIPEIMDEYGLKSLTTTDGTKIEIKSDVSISVRNQEELFKYLRSKNAGDLIKDVIIVQTNGEESRSTLLKGLDEIDCMFENKESIHSATLKKYIKESLEKGECPSGDIVNVHKYRYSKLK